MKKIKLKTEEIILIREAEKSDATEMIAYVKQVGDETDFLTFSAEEFTTTVAEEEVIIENHRKAPNKVFVLVLLEGRIIAMLNVQASHKKRLRHVGEFGISVLKAHWGKGIASYLLQYMIEWAKGNELIKKINLIVQVENTAAVQLYEKFGFEKEGCLRRDFYVDGKYRDSLFMGLMID